MTDVIIAIPHELMKKIRVKVEGPEQLEFDDDAIVQWVLENYLDNG